MALETPITEAPTCTLLEQNGTCRACFLERCSATPALESKREGDAAFCQCHRLWVTVESYEDRHRGRVLCWVGHGEADAVQGVS